MPITKDGSGTIVETPVKDKDQFERTGVVRDDMFAIADDIVKTKQIKFEAGGQAADSSVTIAAGNNSGNVTLTLPSTSGTLVTAAGAANTFSTIQCDSGTSPTADSATDTLTLTGSGGITVTGDATTDTVTIASSAVQSVGTFGSSPDAKGASISGTTITMQPADATHPGMVTTGTQTMAGDKTFSGNVTASVLKASSDLNLNEAAAAQPVIKWNTTNADRILFKGNTTTAFLIRADGYVTPTTGYTIGTTLLTNRQIWDSSGNTMAFYSGGLVSGFKFLNTTDTTNSFTDGFVHIAPPTAATVGLVIKGAGSQTADFITYKNSGGTALGGRYSNGIPYVPSFTVGTLPSASTYTRGIIYVSDETGGATMAFSDGTNWRRMADRAVVS